MAGLTVCLEVLVILALFSSGILYCCVLYKFSAMAKRMRPDVWERARLAVPDRAPDLRVAYGLISDRKLGAEVERLDAQSMALYQKALPALAISRMAPDPSNRSVAGGHVRSIPNYLMVIGLSFMTATVPALAESSQQSSMESIEDLYKAHQVVAHIKVTDVRSLDGKLFCYRVRVIRPFKSGGADIRLFAAIQKATAGDEYLIAANPAERAVKGCGTVLNLHSSSGEIFYPIFRAGALGNGDWWVALKGVALNRLSGSPVIDGNDLCQVNMGAVELMRTCDVFGKIVRWDAVSDMLLKMKN